jgi:putative glutamine amidotransferase
VPATLIGVTTSRNSSLYGFPAFILTEAYANALLDAGAAPVMIPLGLDEEALDRLLSRLDGVLFSGGGDVHPDRYGGQPHPKVDFVDEDRDRVEALLLNHALARRMPVFGICRGLQVINVALGGTLYEDLGDQYPEALQHDNINDQPRDYLAHPVQIEKDSLLAKIVGTDRLEVNSLHHQGVRLLAPSFCATAFAPDGLIEGAELPEYPFGLAVQWHPEWMQAHQPMRRLFQEFTQAAQRYREANA